MKMFASICLLQIVILCGCRRFGADPVIEEFKQAAVLYCSSDIALAERGSLQHYNKLMEWRTLGVEGINYDTSLAEAAGRLFLIYRAKGDSRNAERFFQQSLKHLNRVSIAIARKPKKYSQETLTELISKADANLDVLWKKSAGNP
jgi:hypothetical protein